MLSWLKKLFGKKKTSPNNSFTIETLRYQQTMPSEQSYVDIYHRGEKSLRPLLVYVHGGGWRKGDKQFVASKPDLCLKLGINLASVNYRLSPNNSLDKAKWDKDRFKTDHVLDVANAIKFIQDNASKYGCDPLNIVLMGHSSGAHLVALLAARTSLLLNAGVRLEGIRGACVIDTNFYDLKDRYNVTDPLVPNAFGIQPSKHSEPWSTLDYPSQEQADKVYFEMSPANHVGPLSIPVLLALRGPASAIDKGREYCRQHDAAGVECYSFAYPGSNPYDHNGINQAIGKDTDVSSDIEGVLKKWMFSAS